MTTLERQSGCAVKIVKVGVQLISATNLLLRRILFFTVSLLTSVPSGFCKQHSCAVVMVHSCGFLIEFVVCIVVSFIVIQYSLRVCFQDTGIFIEGLGLVGKIELYILLSQSFV